MTPERAKEIDDVLLASLASGPRYLDMGHSPVEAIERCFALANQGRVYIQSGWVYLNVPAREYGDNNVTLERVLPT